MAITHCSVKNGRAGKGASHARYVQGEGRYASRDDVAFVEHGNMPTFAASNPLAFWKAADANERANGRAYREVEFSVPRELSDEKSQIRFAYRIADRIVGVQFPYTLAMHNAVAADGGRNVHVHLMFSERALDGIERDAVQFFKRANKAHPEKGGAAKDRSLNSREFVKKTRERYEQAVNEVLEKLGVDERISMARNEEREPEPKLGPVHARAERDEKRAARLAAVHELRAARAASKATEQQIRELSSEILDLTTDLKTALVERARQQTAAKTADAKSRIELIRALGSMAAKRSPQAQVPVPPPKAEAPTLSLDQLKAQDRANIAEQPEMHDFTLKLAQTEAGSQYSGRILLVTDFHVAQNAGRQTAILHDRAQLDGTVDAGQEVRIRYDSGCGAVENAGRPAQKHGFKR